MLVTKHITRSDCEFTNMSHVFVLYIFLIFIYMFHITFLVAPGVYVKTWMLDADQLLVAGWVTGTRCYANGGGESTS